MNTTLLMIGALQAVTIIVGLLKGKALSIILGPAEFGVMSTVDQVVVVLISLGSLSLPFTATKFMSRSHSIGAERFEATTASFLRALAILSVLTAAAGLAAVGLEPQFLGSDLLPHTGVLRLAILGIPPAVMHALVINTFAAAQRPIAAACVGFGLALVLAIAAIGGVSMNGLVGLYAGTSIVAFLTLIVNVSYMSHSTGVRIFGPHTDILSELRENSDVLSHAAYIYVAQATIAMAMLVSRYVVLSRLGATSVGLLQSSLSIALTVGAVLAPMSAFYLMPFVNRQMAGVRKISAANTFASKMLLLLFCGGLPVVLFPGLLVSILFSHAFAGAAATLFVFVVWQLIFQVANIYQQVLIGLDDVGFMSISATTGFGVAAGLMYFLVPMLGLGGVGVGLATGMLLYGVAGTIRLNRRHGLMVSRTVAFRAVLVCGVLLAAGLLFRVSSELTLPGMSLRVGYAVTVTGMLWLSLGSGEREVITRARSKLGALWRARGVRME